MTIEHSLISDPNIHEPKGVSTAVAGTVYVADGGGSGSFTNVDELKTGWSDIFGNFVSAKLTGTNQPTWAKIKDDGAGSTGVYGYSFAAAALNELWLSFHIQHDYKVGTTLYPHIHWLPSTSNAGTVRWGMEWTAARGHGQDVFGNTVFNYVEQAAPAIAYRHMLAEVAAPGITVANAEPDMIILCRVFRDAAHVNDTYPDACFGLMLDAHYQINRAGTLNKAPNFYA